VLKIKVGSGATNLLSLSSDKLRSGSQILAVDVATNVYYLETAALTPLPPSSRLTSHFSASDLLLHESKASGACKILVRDLYVSR